MRNLTATICLAVALLLGTSGVSWSQDFQKGFSAYQSGDYATALREWTPLAKQGDAFAQYNLGVMYGDGQGVPQDYKTAVKWYILAAVQGYAKAQYNLGVMYDKGRGVPQNENTALKWYRLAAEQGDSRAQYNLDEMFDKGRGVPEKVIPPAVAEQSLSPCPSDPDQSYDNCFGTYIFADGDKYVGEWSDDKLNGQGTYTFADGDKYVGEYKDGKKNGQGTYIFADGDKYVGEYKDGKKNGQGIYTSASGHKYVGQFRGGDFNGQGTYTSAGGEEYVGHFKDDKFNGQGTYTFADGDKYVGQFKDHKFNGQGIYTSASGKVEEGIWKDDEFQYAQKVTPPAVAGQSLPPCPSDQDQSYDNCFGTYIFADGDRYVGEWSDDKLNGQGTYTFADGDKYVGEWSDDKKNGHGTYTFADGEEYVGGFKDDNYHGQGTLTYASGKIEEGIWKDDEFQYAQQVKPPVVTGQSPTPESQRSTDPNKVVSASSGSGFAVSSNGHVITNHHVIDGCQNVKIHHNGKSFSATVVTYDPQNDLALLKGDFRPSTVLSLSTNSPELLQDVYVAGYPFGRNVSTGVKVTKGIISSLTGIGNNFSNIQIDAALQPGNSGGPIIDDKGNVVGVAVARLDKIKTLEEFGSLPENTNFGIKTSVVRSILESKNISSLKSNRASISKTALGKLISDGTYYLSCWMTITQIEKMRTKKVFFENHE